MKKKLVAKELLKIAKTLLAIDFPTQDALNKYLKEHPDADKSNHKVVKKTGDEALKDAKDAVHHAANNSEKDALHPDNHAKMKQHAKKLVDSLGKGATKFTQHMSDNTSGGSTEPERKKRVLHNMLHHYTQQYAMFK